MSELSSETVHMIDGAEATELLGLAQHSFKWVHDELPSLEFKTDHRLFPEPYITALADSPEWNERQSQPTAASAFARSEVGKTVAERSVSTFETTIDDKLRSIGNAALSNDDVAALLYVEPKTVAMWKTYGPIRKSALLQREKYGIPPHLLFSLYSWHMPASHESSIDDQSTGDLRIELPDHPLLTRPEASKALGISVSGFQRTEQQLQALNFKAGSKRFPRQYVRALLESGVLLDTQSVTAASREFARLPEAARAMANSEDDVYGSIDAISADHGATVRTTDIPDTLRVIARTVRNWQRIGILEVLPHERSQPAYVKSDNLRKAFDWSYPEAYPQNSRR